MSEDELLYAAEPNRVLASGAETLDAIALSFVVRTNGVTIEARTGSVSERTITIDYADIFAVERVTEVAYGVRIETTETEYTVTNVTASLDEIERVVAAVRERITGLRSSTSMPSSGESDDATARSTDATAGSSPAADGGGTRSSSDGDANAAESGGRTTGQDTGSTAGDDGGSALGFGGAEPVTGHSGDIIECPTCGHETLVPDAIPPGGQDVVCPGCSEVIGETHEDGEYVYIDAAAASPSE